MAAPLQVIQAAVTSLRNDLRQLRIWSTGAPDGDLSGLTTTDKSSLVAAINEVHSAVIPQGLTESQDVVEAQRSQELQAPLPNVIDGGTP